MGLLTWLRNLRGKKPSPPPSSPKRSGDPWLNDNERKARINAEAARERGEGGWIERRPGWLGGRRRP
jgi:hypothetical protein